MRLLLALGLIACCSAANATYLASEMADEAVLPSYRRFLRRWLPGILGWIF